MDAVEIDRQAIGRALKLEVKMALARPRRCRIGREAGQVARPTIAQERRPVLRHPFEQGLIGQSAGLGIPDPRHPFEHSRGLLAHDPGRSGIEAEMAKHRPHKAKISQGWTLA